MEKRRHIHKTEARTLTVFKKFNPADFPTRKEATEFRNRQQRIIYYIIAISTIIIIAALTTIITLTHSFITTTNNPQPETTYDKTVQIETNPNNEITTITETLNFGTPTPPGHVETQNNPIIVEYYKNNTTPISTLLEITNVAQPSEEQKYFINNILQTYNEETNPENQLWLTTITHTVNTEEWDNTIDITKHIIPYSTPNNIVEEILITNWKDCTTTTRQTTINDTPVTQIQHCLIFSTQPDKTPQGIKYVGQDSVTPNPYNVYNGEPATIQTTINDTPVTQ